jgi:hypothetical protein
MKKTNENTKSEIIMKKGFYEKELEIIRKIPSKDDLRMYLKNMIEFDNLGTDSYGEKMGCSIYKTYNFLCKNYFPEYYIDGFVDTFNGYYLFNFEKVYELFDNLSDEDIEIILKETNVYPKYIYGLKNNDGTESYFDCAYTRIIRANVGPRNVVLFECFNSELVDLVGKNGPLNAISREVIFINSSQFLIRYLDIGGYTIYGLDQDETKLVMQSCCDIESDVEENDDDIAKQFDKIFSSILNNK